MKVLISGAGIAGPTLAYWLDRAGMARERSKPTKGASRPFIDHKQRAARRLGGWFAPRTRTGLFIRNQITRLAAVPGLSNLIVGPMVAHDLPLPDYLWDSTLSRASA